MNEMMVGASFERGSTSAVPIDPAWANAKMLGGSPRPQDAGAAFEPVTDAALEQAFDAAIEREKKEAGITDLPQFLPHRESTADPQGYAQAQEHAPGLNTVDIQLLDLNCNLKDKRDRRERLQKVILDANEELRRVNKTIAALEIAAEKLAEGV
jgi:hypothetical protein